jgi:uncharacterized protein
MLVDVYEAARTGQRLEGHLSLLELPRALELREVPNAIQAERLGEDASLPSVSWRAEFFRVDAAAQQAQTWCKLHFAARILQQCVRCLEPVVTVIDEARQFVFVGNEERAAELDEDLEMADVLVGSKRFDLAELIEDELILALPPLVQHEVCELPVEIKDEPQAEEAPRKPFDALKNLDWSGGSGKKH